MEAKWLKTWFSGETEWMKKILELLQDSEENSRALSRKKLQP